MTKEETQDVDLENNEQEEEEKDVDLNVDEEESTEDDKDTTDDTDSDEQDTTDWKAEALKQKAINKRLSQKKDPALTAKEETTSPEVTPRLTNLEFLEKKRQFGYENGLSPEETDQIFRLNKNPTKKDLENPFVKGGLDALRAKNRARDNTPSNSSHTVIYKGKDVKEVLHDEKSSNSDKQAAWEKLTGVKK